MYTFLEKNNKKTIKVHALKSGQCDLALSCSECVPSHNVRFFFILTVAKPASVPMQKPMEPSMSSSPYFSAGRPSPGPAPTQQKTAINFDNPSVQKALEDLMQNGPQLLQSFNPSTSAEHAGVYGSVPSSNTSGLVAYRDLPRY